MVWACEEEECGCSSERCEKINIPEGRRGKGRPKKSLDEVIREDLKVTGLTEDMAQDWKLWRDKIKTVDRGESSL